MAITPTDHRLVSVSVLSISSLADAVFEFKGFIVDAIAAYRVVTAEIERILAPIIPFDDLQLFIDLIVSVNLLAFAEPHAFMTVMPIKRWEHIRGRTFVFTLLFNWVFTGAMAAIVAWLV